MSLLAVSLGAIGALDEGQKLESARRQTRGGGGGAKVSMDSTSHGQLTLVVPRTFLAAYSPPTAFPVQPFHAIAVLLPGICFSKPG
jgi:hypothetical protein